MDETTVETETMQEHNLDSFHVTFAIGTPKYICVQEEQEVWKINFLRSVISAFNNNNQSSKNDEKLTRTKTKNFVNNTSKYLFDIYVCW